MTSPARARWDRLAEQISEQAIPVSVSSSTYPGGVSYYITRKLDNGLRVDVHDAWWRKNADVWIGYHVYTENSDSIEQRSWPLTKKRSEVVAAIKAAADA